MSADLISCTDDFLSQELNPVQWMMHNISLIGSTSIFVNTLRKSDILAIFRFKNQGKEIVNYILDSDGLMEFKESVHDNIYRSGSNIYLVGPHLKRRRAHGGHYAS